MIVIVTPALLESGYQLLILALELLGVPLVAAFAAGYALWKVTAR